MGKMKERFMEHRQQEEQREAQEQAAREAAFLTNRKQSGETAHKTKDDERRKDGKR